MHETPGIRESVLSARRRLAEGREAIRQQHASGSPGIQVCAHLTELLDEVVLELYEAALADLAPAEGVEELREAAALAPHGGFGRRDVAPFSDVDLMILHAPGEESRIAPLASRLMRDVFDAGLTLGQSARTPAGACRLAAQDPTICTTLMESRFLAGSSKLYDTFREKFQRTVRRRSNSLVTAIAGARRSERSQFGETVYLLEPNVKRSRGALRDIQLLRWIGSARYGEADPSRLQLLGVLSPEDAAAIRRALEFLLRVRNELHFQAGAPNDVLDRSEQLRLAELYGFTGGEGILPVEQFMSEYFQHTSSVRSVAANFFDAARPGARLADSLGLLLGRRVDGDYRLTPRYIVATDHGLAKVRTNLSEVMRLADLANLYDKRIDSKTWRAVREAAPKLSADHSAETSASFLSLLSRPYRLGELLRRLHELGVLEKIIPAFAHARCLLQFNEYHKFTVDEHCLLAVERATEFMSHTGQLGRVYRSIKNKRILHLALLIHDLGKGFVEDHSEVGLRIAGETAQLLRLNVREAEALKFLVHKHLTMSHLAFRRDTTDEQVVVRFAVEVGSPELLDMLFVLTAADFCAVGPGVWNDWKADVLAALYEQTMERLAGDTPGTVTSERMREQRAKVLAELSREADPAWHARQVEALPASYVLRTPAARVVAELRDLASLRPGEAHASGHFLPGSQAVEFIVGTHEDVTPGIFHKLTGALASQGIEILSADINTLADGLVFDRFYVHDPDYAGEPPKARIDEVTRALVESLSAPMGQTPAFRKLWRSESQRGAVQQRLPTRVRSDNNSSDRFTIIDVFASDRMGLLYTIARTLFELGLSVSVAKIGTYLDQVTDVFYVTDQAGNKIQDDERLHVIAARVIEAIDSMPQ